MIHQTSSLLLLFLLLFLFIAHDVAAQDRFYGPGVGFVLTPDYGMASIYFENGTSVPVARIQGRPQYQALMRRNTSPASVSSGILCTVLSPALRGISSAFGMDLKICLQADIVSTTALLTSLKTEVESYLGTNFCFAAIGVDGIGKDSFALIEEAFHSIGLRQSNPIISAGKLEVYAKLEGRESAQGGPWNILAVGYSSYGFTVGLYTMDDGVVDAIKEESFARSRSLVNGDGGDPSALDGIEDALQRFILKTLPDRNPPGQIQHLVLYGDMATDGPFQRLLSTVLDADLVQNASTSSSPFGGTTYMAKSSYKNIFWDFRVEPAFGCRWRSKLYSDGSYELFGHPQLNVHQEL